MEMAALFSNTFAGGLYSQIPFQVILSTIRFGRFGTGGGAWDFQAPAMIR